MSEVGSAVGTNGAGAPVATAPQLMTFGASDAGVCGEGAKNSRNTAGAQPETAAATIPAPTTAGAGYPAHVVNARPGPRGLPTVTACPDISPRTTKPVNRRPTAIPTAACPSSCTRVTTMRTARHSGGMITTASASPHAISSRCSVSGEPSSVSCSGEVRAVRSRIACHQVASAQGSEVTRGVRPGAGRHRWGRSGGSG